MIFMITCLFWFTALGRADQYLNLAEKGAAAVQTPESPAR